MKHGISPTTPRGQIFGRMIHISMPLALRCEDKRTDEERVKALPNLDIPLTGIKSHINRVFHMWQAITQDRVRIIPVNQTPAPWEVVRLVKAPMKGLSYKAPWKAPRPGLAARYRASGRVLSELRRLVYCPKAVAHG